MKCKNCGEKIIRFPIWEGQEKEVPFSLDKVRWLNLFKIDLYSLMWLAVLIFLILAYKADIGKCEEMITDPLKYCEESNACKIIEERRSENPFGIIDVSEIPEINESG